MSCNLTDKVKTLENLIRLSVICLREAARARTPVSRPSGRPSYLVPRSVRAIQIKRGGLEWSAIFRRLGTSLRLSC